MDRRMDKVNVGTAILLNQHNFRHNEVNWYSLMWKNSLKHMFKWKKTISMVWFSLGRKTDKTTGWIQLCKNSRKEKSNWEGIEKKVRVECFACYIYCFKLCQWFVHALIVYILKTKKIKGGTFLRVQWLRLQASKAGNKGFDPWSGK